MSAATNRHPVISVQGLVTRIGDKVLHDQIDLEVYQSEVLGVVGGSGSGKSVLLRSIIGLQQPSAGRIEVLGQNVADLDGDDLVRMQIRWGVLFQDGALFGDQTVAENVQVPLREHTDLSQQLMAEVASVKLSMVGLPPDAATKYPSELSGGMRKRAGLARALAMDPDVLFFDEPSAGLDPITSSRLDDLILQLRDGLGATIVIVSHELPSLFAIADDGVFLDAESKTAIAHGSPAALRDSCPNPQVEAFMRRERPEALNVQAQPGPAQPGKAQPSGQQARS
jgi:phospholipid/cholesterol/gamma-HCH transport system ATP-binding protein